MRRFTMAGTVAIMLGVLSVLAGSTAARAGDPQHVTTTFSFDNLFPAGGMFCDFDYLNVGTGTDNEVIFADRTIETIDLQVTHTNLATGFTLTETDHFTVFTAAGGQNKQVGIFWHLRNADGKIVVVQAGQLVISSTGDVLKFTPNTNPDFTAVICPALGGHPAS